ncbi:MAG: S9 family peptidase [Hyphomonadaceae bacterium]|nr:S9 family peptidase [Hyphomonadaceae bacterium]
MRKLAGAALLLAALLLGSCNTAGAMAASDQDNLWLEEIEGERALAWVRDQNARSLAVLEADSRYPQLYADALAIANSRDRLALGEVREGHLYNFWQDETQVRGVWRRSPLADYTRGEPRWETLLDIDALAHAENANWVFKGAVCLDGSSRCMLALSDGGRDAITWREFDTTSRRFVEGGFVVPTAKSSVAWVDANTLNVATDWGEGSMTASGYPAIVKRWARGAPLSEAVEILRAPLSDVGVYVGTLQDTDGRLVPIATQAQTFFESVSWRLDAASPQRFNLPPRATIRGLFQGQLVFSLEQAWRGLPQAALAAYPLADAGAENPRTSLLFAPGPRQSIEDVAVTRDAVLAAGYENVRGRILRFTRAGASWTQSVVDLPQNGSVNFAGASPTEAAAFAVFRDFLTPDTLYALEDGAAHARTVRALPAQFDSAPYITEQYEAVSSDGVRVPYFVVRRRDMPFNGDNPTLLWAYGGFQLSYPPFYSGFVGRMWLAHGGVYVIANIRGGGEFGPAWHQAGLRTNRQIIFDDFYAVQRDLVERGVTSPRRLGIMGGSNGGLLMGVMLNQHPEMVNAAVVQVPLLDMLRYDQLLAGASWVDEYGSPANPEERAFLETISPLQNLRPRPDFPTPFVLTSTKDDRVHPGHARRYVARMLALGMPVLYYENIDGGHAAAANLNEAARRRALEYTYLMQRLVD